jgi:5-methylthioadenosine/S-adenosylhomocysteine deaminase
MVNGKWLMRAHQLLTVNEADLLKQAREVALKIDAFLIVREQSVLSKLIALGGSMEQESFEVQVKVKVAEPDKLVQNMKRPEIEIDVYKHYHQYDEYYMFEDPSQGRLRFREDNLIDEKGEVENVRSRLTLLGQQREGEVTQDVLL